MNILHRIKKFRELRNFTQEYVAEQLNLSTSGYGKIERNATDVTYSKLRQIADLFEIDISFLVNEHYPLINFVNNQHNQNGIVINQLTENE